MPIQYLNTQLLEDEKSNMADSANWLHNDLTDDLRQRLTVRFTQEGFNTVEFHQTTTFLRNGADVFVFPNVYYHIASMCIGTARLISEYEGILNNLRLNGELDDYVSQPFFLELQNSGISSYSELQAQLRDVDANNCDHFFQLFEGVVEEENRDQVVALICNPANRLDSKQKINSSGIRSDFFTSTIKGIFPLTPTRHGTALSYIVKYLCEDFGLYSQLAELYAATVPPLGEIEEQEPEEIDGAKQRIIYGAPGTGKSWKLKEELIGIPTIRVTFNPEYTYGQFVGTYKPIMVQQEGEDKESISYELVEGPFLRAFIQAKVSGDPTCLLIEEINRANVSAVFGDVFQLLDRDESGKSEYPITFHRDIMKHLAKKNIINSENSEIKLPSNLYIWATMNSADQGVFPMDSAFKRRWSFEYLGIDDGENANGRDQANMKFNSIAEIKWNDFRKKLNKFLSESPSLKVNEDKLIGPFFLTDEELEGGGFKGKLLLYLWDDVLRHKDRSKLFKPSTLSGIHKLLRVENPLPLEDVLNGVFSDEFKAIISPPVAE